MKRKEEQACSQEALACQILLRHIGKQHPGNLTNSSELRHKTAPLCSETFPNSYTKSDMSFVKAFTNEFHNPSKHSRGANDVISAVRFNPERVYIEQVRAHPDHGDAVGAPCEYTRQNIAFSIKAGGLFVTATQNEKGIWKKGQPIHIVTIDGKEYLKVTNDHCEEADSLGDIPEF